MYHYSGRTLSDKIPLVVNCRRLFLLVILSLSGTILLSSAAMSVAQTSSTKAKTAAKSKAAKKRGSKSVASKRKKKMTPRVRRIRRAFVASSSLRPMARQLLQDRTPAGYAGVEAYARRHSKEDAGSLAWLVVGYAHIVDHDYVKAIDPLNRAKLHAGDLSEYVNYYLGTAYMQAGRSAECIATLSSFARDFPDSILLRDAHVVYANALMQEGRPQDAATLLEGDRQPARVDVEWNLGRAYEAAGNLPKAASIFRNIYLTMPLTGEAELANSELKKLAGSTTVQPANVDERKTRADLLLKGRRYADAAEEYKDLLEQVSPEDRAGTQLSLATALLKSGHGKDAKKILDSLAPSSADTNAQKLYLLGEVARGSDNDDEFLKDLDQLRQQAPTSPWLEQGLLSAGNVFLLRKDYDRAIDAYRELQQRFPNAGRAPYAHWKAAWLTLRQGRKAEAEKEFEEQIGLYPSSNEVPAALYWRARLAEEDGETAKARAFYQKLSDRFRNYYYADLARKQLKVLKSSGEPISYALLDKVAPIDAKADIVADDPPSDNLRVRKAELLGNGGLVDLAARELQAASNEEKGDWVAPEPARLFQENELYNRGIEIMKRAVPNYFAMDIPALPRS